MNKVILKSLNISSNTIVNLENRDISLWIRGFTDNDKWPEDIDRLIGLPWHSIVIEGQADQILPRIENQSEIDNSLIRKRGFIQIIESDPSRIDLPPRCLPVYLLDGRKKNWSDSSFEKQLRRFTMLEAFRRSSIKELLIISPNDDTVPKDIIELWKAGFRAQLTFVSEIGTAESKLQEWLEQTPDIFSIAFVQRPYLDVLREIDKRYTETYPETNLIIRMHDDRGELHKIDITHADEPERPILDFYSLIQERDLAPLVPSDVSQEDFVAFFKNQQNSWRPFAAGLPWIKDPDCYDRMQRYLRRLDIIGPEENCIAYIASEPGAGGTTLARAMAWKFAREGYPVLLAKPFDFAPDPLPIINFFTRVHRIFSDQTGSKDSSQDNQGQSADEKASTFFETPWIIVFDTLHWQNREDELLKFRNELAKSGRVVCLLNVTNNILDLVYVNSASFKKIAELNHSISLPEARALGQHLNEFLRYYGNTRTQTQWDNFYEEHTTRYLDGVAAFWVTLSFWIQGQYDLSESIQQWIYRSFKEQSSDSYIQDALLQIAAMSSERYPLPQGLLPEVSGKWPVWQLLEDNISNFSKLGLTQISAQGEKQWALVHDILGRLIINALFYDFPTREALGFDKAINPEHLRFLILSKVSANKRIAERAYKTVGETFATEIFKIDPERGKTNLAEFWREVLGALDSMPQLLRNSSRVFRHHTAISRRRVAKLSPDYYGIREKDKVDLLDQAIRDLNYALVEIPYSASSEPDLNLLNSLALAYFDLAEVQTELGASKSYVAELKKHAIDATQRAYQERPDNSFVIETYVRSVLQTAQDDPDNAIENCVKALGILYSALRLGSDSNRGPQLERLADKTLDILISQNPKQINYQEPKNSIDVLVHAWLVLAEGRNQGAGWSITDVPVEQLEKALSILEHPSGQGNSQILFLRYHLLCVGHPYDFKNQINLLEPLYLSGPWMSPQLQLEYAILLFQNSRANEGDKIFRSLRRLWQTSENFVQVPKRLHWLLSIEEKKPITVRATYLSENDTRAFANVQELANIKVPFRPEEHGFTNLQPRMTFRCFVSFGYNGPFLRPLTTRISLDN